MPQNRSIKDFYVRLGVEFDDAGMRHFEKVVDDVNKKLGESSIEIRVLGNEARKTESAILTSFGRITTASRRLTVGIGATGGAVLFAAQKISRGLIDVNNLANQTGASVKDIELFRRQLEQVGGSADEADSFIQNFATRIAQLRLMGGDAGIFLPQIFTDDTDLQNPVKALERIRSFLLDSSREQRLLVAEDLGLSPQLVGLLTRSEADFEAIKRRAETTQVADSRYIDRAKQFQSEFSSLQAEFRRIKLDLFLGASKEVEAAAKELKDFLADEDIKTIIVAAVRKISDLFKIMIRGFGGLLDRISVASGQLSRGEELGAIKTLITGTPEQQQDQLQKRLEQAPMQELQRRLNRISDVNAPETRALFGALRSKGVQPGDIDLPASLQRMIGVAPSEDAIKKAFANGGQASTSNNVTNNITNNFNQSTTTVKEAGVIESQIKQAVSSFDRKDVN